MMSTDANHSHSGNKRVKDDDEDTDDSTRQQNFNPEDSSTVTTNKKPRSIKKFPNLEPTDHSHFDHFLFHLLVFRSANSNYNVTKEEYPQLHAWLQHLKREYKNKTSGCNPSKLTDEQVQVLEYLHVPITSRGDEHWNRFYEMLVAYKKRHGHVLVPRLCEVPGLGDWVTDQRRQHKALHMGQASQLNDERINKLNELDFVWQVRNRPEWEARYQELLEYKALNGDCRVPQHFNSNKALGKWVAKQREQYKLLKAGKHSFLTPYRLEKLEQAGFVWSVRMPLESEVRNVIGESSTTANATITTESMTARTTPKQEHHDVDIKCYEDGKHDDETDRIDAAI